MNRRKWGPWTRGEIEELRHDMRAYFETYYGALRELVVEHDKAADLPSWLKGGRGNIERYARVSENDGRART